MTARWLWDQFSSDKEIAKSTFEFTVTKDHHLP